MTSIEERRLALWLDMAMDPAKFPSPKPQGMARFPSDESRDLFLSKIREYDDDVIIAVLDQLLIQNSNLSPQDELYWQSAWRQEAALQSELNGLSPEAQERVLSARLGPRYVRIRRQRRNDPFPAWEGITWIRNLIPSHPHLALEVLQAYRTNHLDLPDDWVHAVFDAQAVIQARYIGEPGHFENRRAVLCGLTPRKFELLAVNLYSEMGYKISATGASRDGGVDGRGSWPLIGRAEKIILQAKRHSRLVGVAYVRELDAVVRRERANRGILIAASDFTRGARDEAAQFAIELISGNEFAVLLNRYAGFRWADQLEYWTRDAVKEREKQRDRLRQLAQQLGPLPETLADYLGNG